MCLRIDSVSSKHIYMQMLLKQVTEVMSVNSQSSSAKSCLAGRIYPASLTYDGFTHLMPRSH